MQPLRICWRQSVWISKAQIRAASIKSKAHLRRAALLDQLAKHRPECQRQQQQQQRQKPPEERRPEQHGQESNRITVNEFEEPLDGSEADRKPVQPPKPNPQEERLTAEIAALEDDLERNAALGEEPTQPEIVEEESPSTPNKSSLDDVLKQFFSEETLKQIGVRSEESEEQEGGLSAHEVSPSNPIPRQSQLHLNRLNKALDEARLDPNDKQLRAEVWRWYIRSKPNVPGFLRMIPKAAWDVLWNTQNAPTLSDKESASRLTTIADDKVSAGWELTKDEDYARLQSMFLTGNTERAITEWERRRGGGDGADSEFLDLGVRMYAQHRKPRRAHEILNTLFDLDSSADPRIITQVLRSYVYSPGDQNDAKEAWLLYQQLQARLSTDMKMEDYDIISKDFLVNDEKDFALAVFRDMMLRGEPQDEESKTLYSAAMSKIGRFMRGGTAVDVSSFSLDAIKFMPRRFQNKYFYASWLRKLISEDQLAAAAQVIELMYERSISPDANHMNGLIGAYFRQSTFESRAKAESLAWAMIQRRVDFIQQRRQDASQEESNNTTAPPPQKSVRDSTDGVSIPAFKARSVPSANIETFCILAQHYQQRGMPSHLQHLRNLLPEAAITMNPFFLNQLLYSERSISGHQNIWTSFSQLTRTTPPDIETWSILWECMQVHLDSGLTSNVDIPRLRDLFAHFISWFCGLEGQARKNALEDMRIEWYNDLFQTFCMSRDLEGSFIVLYTLRNEFELYPNELTVRLLLAQISRLDVFASKVTTPKKGALASRRRLVQHRAGQTEAEAIAVNLLGTIREHREGQYREYGLEIGELQGVQGDEENLRMCLELLQVVIRRRVGEERYNGGETILRAAEAMGVERFDVEEAMVIVV